MTLIPDRVGTFETKLAACNASPFDLDDPTAKEGTGTVNSLQNNFLYPFLRRGDSETGESHYQIQNRRSKVRIPGYEGEETRKKKVL